MWIKAELKKKSILLPSRWETVRGNYRKNETDKRKSEAHPCEIGCASIIFIHFTRGHKKSGKSFCDDKPGAQFYKLLAWIRPTGRKRKPVNASRNHRTGNEINRDGGIVFLVWSRGNHTLPVHGVGRLQRWRLIDEVSAHWSLHEVRIDIKIKNASDKSRQWI